MKRFICIALLIVFLVPMISCDNSTQKIPETTSPINDTVKQFNDLVSEIYNYDEGTQDYLTAVEKAENAYNQLENKDILSESNRSSILYHIGKRYIYYIEKKSFEKVKNDFAKRLKNPSSLQIHHLSGALYYDDKPDGNSDIPVCVKIDIDYSAQNGFGGYNRDKITIYYKIKMNSNSSFDLIEISFDEYYNLKQEKPDLGFDFFSDK